MNMVFETFWTLINSPVGITAIITVVLWILNRIYAAKPLWQQYEGTIIAAVKFAEKEIPDGIANTSIARLDAALKYTVNIYEEMVQRRASNVELANFKEGIQIKHAELEQAGGLK
ncbi:MAG: hypothetical protein A2Y07_06865 [Planctomycetes bacterium GWF2_50_10]|nr:MAG: hypothetical protein A2Y07_06865 [Planctomycetes bacterium GWF2_50_10]